MVCIEQVLEKSSAYNMASAQPRVPGIFTLLRRNVIGFFIGDEQKAAVAGVKETFCNNSRQV